MNGEIKKSATVESNVVSDKDLKLINKYTMRELKADEVFTFKLAMCDNQVDRDSEQFTDNALAGLAKLFKGKTVIADHRNTSQNQCARIYNTEVIEDGNAKRLVAYCYTVSNDKNKDFISDVEGGIKKEVSVGCAIEKAICSICGTDNRKSYCSHYPGREYAKESGKEKCVYKLDGAKDAYEVSFVAVPAQKEAGVIKAYGEKPCTELPKENKSIESDVGLKIKLMDAFNFIENEKRN